MSKMPAKKEPPHLVFHKQPSIQKKDPFQTGKEEEKAGKVMSKAVEKYRDGIIKRLQEELPADE